MGEVVKTKGDANAEPADIVAADQKKEEKNKARDARKKAAAEEKKKEKEEELKKQRKYQLQQVNSIRNKDHHNRQLPRLHPAPPPVKPNVPTSPVACAKMGPISGAAASKKSDKAAATRFLVTQLETFPVLKMAPISSADASENIDINQPAPVTPVSSSTGSEERSFFVGRILFRISSSSNQTKTNDQQTNDEVRLEFGKDTDQGTIMCSQINKDNNNAAAATDVPGTTTVTNQLADELNMKEKQVISDAKTTMNPAKNSDDNDDDDDDKFEEARGKGFIRAEPIELNAEATERTENQAIRKEGYNKFSVLLKESENVEEQDIDRAAEEAATKTEEKPHESEKEQDIEARRADEAATTAKKKREKRERKKKRKVVAVATTIEDNNNAAVATDVPGTTTMTNQLADELNMKEKQVISDAKTTMNPAKNSDDNDDDDDDKFEEARGKGFIRAEPIALNAEATERTENQAIRKEGYNKFSVLLKESENEEEQDIDRTAEEAATKTEEKPHESEKEQDIEARRADEAATTAKKKREKRERKKKRKVVAVATTIEEKSHESGSDAQSWSSVGVLSLALVCFLSLTAFYMS